MSVIIIISFFVVSILGVLLHFTHKIFKKGILVHIFSAVNESTWEHMKLAFYPLVLTVFIHSFLTEFSHPGFWGVGFITVISSASLIPLLYYPIRFLLKREIIAISIGLYFVCILIAFLLEYFLIKDQIYLVSDTVGKIGLLITFIAFAIFTFFPPRSSIFKDPIHKKYGEFKQKFDKASVRHPHLTTLFKTKIVRLEIFILLATTLFALLSLIFKTSVFINTCFVFLFIFTFLFTIITLCYIALEPKFKFSNLSAKNAIIIIGLNSIFSLLRLPRTIK